MRLCLITYCTVTTHNGRFCVNDKFGRFIDELASQFKQITFVGSRAREDDPTFYPSGRSVYTYAITASNVRVVQTAYSGVCSPPLEKAIIVLTCRLVPYFTAIANSDLVYITMPGFSGFIAYLICRILRKPYCLYFGSDWEEVSPFMARWERQHTLIYQSYVKLAMWAERLAVRHAMFTLVHGRKLLRKLGGPDAKVFETIPMISVGRQHVYEREDTCQQETIRCLYVGTLTPRKGVHFLLEALRILLDRGYNVQVRLVGVADAHYMETLQALSSTLGIDSQVEFCGYITDLDELLKFYRDADIFVLPTFGEGFPRVLYEAMSQGLPIVTTAIGTIASTLEHERYALLVPPASSEGLANAIETLINRPELRRSLIQHGYSFFLSVCTSRTTADQVACLIRDMLSGKRPSLKVSGTS